MNPMPDFEALRRQVEKQYEDAVFPPESGWTEERLKADYAKHLEAFPDEPRQLQRAWVQALLMRHAPIALEKWNPFCGKLRTFGINAADLDHGCKLAREKVPGVVVSGRDDNLGILWQVDRSHIAPDWKAVLALGIPGLLARVKNRATEFHRACEIVLEALAEFCRRAGALNGNATLSSLADRAPETLYEAFLLAYVFHDMIEEGNVAVRTMGRFDELYVDFYRRDRARGMSRDEAKNLIKFFWTAFYAKHQGTRFGKNFCFGPDFNELSHLGMETYHELDTVDPKLSVLFRKDMPQDFLECYARNIRDGRTGIVTLNYDVVVEGLVRHGRLREDAEDFIPIGCYEPAVAGKEVGLSGCTLLLLPQVLVHLLGLGEDHGTFDALFARYLDHIDETCRELQSRQLLCDAAWKYVNPVPLLSSTFESCVEKGRDVSDAGAVYNTTGNVACHIADAVDSLCAIRCLVYERRQCTLDELREAVASDWRGHEALRCMALKVPPKWGNDDDAADALGVAIAERVSKTLSALENGRGGRFFPSLYGQGVTETGARLGAFPSGRNAGEPVSKNMDAVIGMDRNGITSLMNSVLKIDMTQFPCGTCLDIMLHPGSVRGDRGVRTIADLIRIFVTRGGSGIQFNIFDADVLRDAQRRPENHDGLQVRVCGWNAKFTGLTTAAQNTFIREAEKHG